MFRLKNCFILTTFSLLVLLTFSIFSLEVKAYMIDDDNVLKEESNINQTSQTMSLKPTLERISGGGLGLVKFGTNTTANSYAKSIGYSNAHALKRAYVPEPISRFNIFYSKVNKSVYILDKNNRGVRTDFHYPPRK